MKKLHVALLAIAYLATVAVGASSCKCLSELPSTVPRDSGGQTVTNKDGQTFPVNYATRCSNWDITYHPECQGHASEDETPAWCYQPWCYVEPNCTSSDRQPTFFWDNVDLQFSYETCGGVDLFSPSKCMEQTTFSGCVATCSGCCYWAGEDSTLSSGDNPCWATTKLPVKYRDFRSSHPDFEATTGSFKGIVQSDLNVSAAGTLRLPLCNSATIGSVSNVANCATFDQWYQDVEGVNTPVIDELTLAHNPCTGLLSFSSYSFFPLNGRGFNTGVAGNNYFFTSEMHTNFRYNGGERFSFLGDDDVFVFINGKLVIDLGGIHNPESASVDIDTLGLTVGGVYPLDMFHAERRPQRSTFQLTSTIVQGSSDVCPGACGILNQRGSCDDGACRCASGWKGIDCSCPADATTCIVEAIAMRGKDTTCPSRNAASSGPASVGIGMFFLALAIFMASV